ncbi:MAG: 50S ribosomal protein L19 [Candidatus Levybacteria bacterium RBG_16_35_6]|nr:MAG: 50S ribosomal protein L19 [Candidatus Levybacteria bacterium RBG_16_35_6]
MINQTNFVPGDVIRVHQKIKEIDTSQKGGGKEKTRIQVFEGVVLGIKGRGDNKSFTVRKTVEDIAVERIFSFKSPNIEKVDVKGHIKGKVRRAKLNYLRKNK